MRQTVQKKLGKNTYNFQFEGATFFDCLQDAQRLSFPNIEKCPLCGSDDLYLTSYITKEKKYKYIKVACNGCMGSLTLGKSQEHEDTYFFRKTDDGKYDWKKYEPKEIAEQPKKKEYTVEQDQDVPF